MIFGSRRLLYSGRNNPRRPQDISEVIWMYYDLLTHFPPEKQSKILHNCTVPTENKISQLLSFHKLGNYQANLCEIPRVMRKCK